MENIRFIIFFIGLAGVAVLIAMIPRMLRNLLHKLGIPRPLKEDISNEKKAMCHYCSTSICFVLLLLIGVVGAFGWGIYKIQEQQADSVLTITTIMGLMIVFVMLLIWVLLMMINNVWVFTEEYIIHRDFLGKEERIPVAEVQRCRKRSYPRQTFMEIQFESRAKIQITYHAHGFNEAWEFVNKHYR